MKLILLVALLTISLSVTYGKRCTTEDDCDDGKCCVALLGTHMARKGICLRLNRNDDKVKRKLYAVRLLNELFLKMKFTTVVLLFIGLGMMVSGLEEAKKKPCQTEEECEENECCVAHTIDDLYKNGTCKPFTTKGENCSENEAILSYFGGKYVMFCPCENQLDCQPLNETDSNIDSIVPDFSCRERDINFRVTKFVVPNKEYYRDYYYSQENDTLNDATFQQKNVTENSEKIVAEERSAKNETGENFINNEVINSLSNLVTGENSTKIEVEKSLAKNETIKNLASNDIVNTENTEKIK